LSPAVSLSSSNVDKIDPVGFSAARRLGTSAEQPEAE
jgi:hypothetical protein